jgi:hypothetical protein
MDLAPAGKVFSTVFGIAYSVAFYFSWSPFLYYPEQSAFHIAQQLPSAGPPILWYGWLTVATAVSGVVAAIVPAQLVRKLPSAVFWIVPALVLLALFFYEKRWFL